MWEVASATEAAALYIVITVVKYVGQFVAVPALWERATRAPCPLFENHFHPNSFIVSNTLMDL